MTITLNIEGASAEEIKNEIAKLFSGSDITVGQAAPMVVVTEEPKKTSTRSTKTKTEETAKTEEAAPETGAHGYTFEQIQALAAQVDEKPQIKTLVATFKLPDGNPCERMSQVQPKDWAAFAGGLKLIIDNQI